MVESYETKVARLIRDLDNGKQIPQTEGKLQESEIKADFKWGDSIECDGYVYTPDMPEYAAMFYTIKPYQENKSRVSDSGLAAELKNVLSSPGFNTPWGYGPDSSLAEKSFNSPDENQQKQIDRFGVSIGDFDNRENYGSDEEEYENAVRRVTVEGDVRSQEEIVGDMGFGDPSDPVAFRNWLEEGGKPALTEREKLAIRKKEKLKKGERIVVSEPKLHFEVVGSDGDVLRDEYGDQIYEVTPYYTSNGNPQFTIKKYGKIISNKIVQDNWDVTADKKTGERRDVPPGIVEDGKVVGRIVAFDETRFRGSGTGQKPEIAANANIIYGAVADLNQQTEQRKLTGNNTPQPYPRGEGLIDSPLSVMSLPQGSGKIVGTVKTTESGAEYVAAAIPTINDEGKDIIIDRLGPEERAQLPRCLQCGGIGVIDGQYCSKCHGRGYVNAFRLATKDDLAHGGKMDAEGFLLDKYGKRIAVDADVGRNLHMHFTAQSVAPGENRNFKQGDIVSGRIVLGLQGHELVDVTKLPGAQPVINEEKQRPDLNEVWVLARVVRSNNANDGTNNYWYELESNQLPFNRVGKWKMYEPGSYVEGSHEAPKEQRVVFGDIPRVYSGWFHNNPIGVKPWAKTNELVAVKLQVQRDMNPALYDPNNDWTKLPKYKLSFKAMEAVPIVPGAEGMKALENDPSQKDLLNAIDAWGLRKGWKTFMRKKQNAKGEPARDEETTSTATLSRSPNFVQPLIPNRVNTLVNSVAPVEVLEDWKNEMYRGYQFTDAERQLVFDETEKIKAKLVEDEIKKYEIVVNNPRYKDAIAKDLRNRVIAEVEGKADTILVPMVMELMRARLMSDKAGLAELKKRVLEKAHPKGNADSYADQRREAHLKKGVGLTREEKKLIRDVRKQMTLEAATIEMKKWQQPKKTRGLWGKNLLKNRLIDRESMPAGGNTVSSVQLVGREYTNKEKEQLAAARGSSPVAWNDWQFDESGRVSSPTQFYGVRDDRQYPQIKFRWDARLKTWFGRQVRSESEMQKAENDLKKNLQKLSKKFGKVGKNNRQEVLTTDRFVDEFGQEVEPYSESHPGNIYKETYTGSQFYPGSLKETKSHNRAGKGWLYAGIPLLTDDVGNIVPNDSGDIQLDVDTLKGHIEAEKERKDLDELKKAVEEQNKRLLGKRQ